LKYFRSCARCRASSIISNLSLKLYIPSYRVTSLPHTHTHIVSIYFVHLSHNNIHSLAADGLQAASKSFRIIAIHGGKFSILCDPLTLGSELYEVRENESS
jgi:hypothetical protein